MNWAEGKKIEVACLHDSKGFLGETLIFLYLTLTLCPPPAPLYSLETSL